MPPPKAAKKTKPDNVLIAFTADGVDYRCDLTAIANRDELDLFNASGLTLGAVAKALGSGAPPPFAIAGVMFLALRQSGQSASYDKLLDSIDRFDFDVAAIEDDSPEA